MGDNYWMSLFVKNYSDTKISLLPFIEFIPVK